MISGMTIAVSIFWTSIDAVEGHCPSYVRLYGADFVKGVPQGSYSFSCPSVSLFDLAARFFVPTHSIETPARAGAVKDGRVAPTRKGLVLDGSEHDGTLVVVGMTTSEGSCR